MLCDECCVLCDECCVRCAVIYCANTNVAFSLSLLSFFLFFPVVAFASPAAVCISAMWNGFFIPFNYCMMDSFSFLYAAPIAYVGAPCGALHAGRSMSKGRRSFFFILTCAQY